MRNLKETVGHDFEKEMLSKYYELCSVRHSLYSRLLYLYDIAHYDMSTWVPRSPQ